MRRKCAVEAHFGLPPVRQTAWGLLGRARLAGQYLEVVECAESLILPFRLLAWLGSLSEISSLRGRVLPASPFASRAMWSRVSRSRVFSRPVNSSRYLWVPFVLRFTSARSTRSNWCSRRPRRRRGHPLGYGSYFPHLILFLNTI